MAPAAAAAPDAAKEKDKAKAAERRRVFQNHRDVLFGEVLVNTGAGTRGAVFPNGTPALPAHASFASTPSLAAGASVAFPFGLSAVTGVLAGALGGVMRGLASVRLPARGEPRGLPPGRGGGGGGGGGALGMETTVDMGDVRPPPAIKFSDLSEETIRQTKGIVDPVDGIIKRIRSLVSYRGATFTVSEIPCSPERNDVYRCYHEAHGAALARRKRDFVGGDPTGLWRPTEVLACESLVNEYLKCAGLAREAYVQRVAQSGW
eukprot:TRINITY_DN3809_c0_g1_i1.p1 TRINITY_DN3809_c0_g1~~TRINITY_DN3809_c0_g1_i1.p1  ORF type:complete len:279 (+),score=110.95 TRINITY_DN3809_c0_g1_i1:54-839(+)